MKVMHNTQIIHEQIFLKELKKMSKNMFGELIKAVVDIEKKIMAIDAELHSDEEKLLLENGSLQQNLWGINLYPDNFGTEDLIEFDSMINIRPSWGNKSRGVEDQQIQQKIISIVNKLVTK